MAEARSRQNKRYIRWVAVNILLPLSPFIVRMFVSFVGRSHVRAFDGQSDLPEIVFFSVFVCIANLNINLNGRKGYFESTIRFVISAILMFDCILLGMIYSNNVGKATLAYTLFAAIAPAIIAPFYKFTYRRSLL